MHPSLFTHILFHLGFTFFLSGVLGVYSFVYGMSFKMGNGFIGHYIVPWVFTGVYRFLLCGLPSSLIFHSY